ncbi:MAG: hypothetical protein HC840_28570 [Leptolyngbyaceae cyanobacterium RM2_2_4]|nr:hypothetical protein [Leptolyngbyaceae cyanobacterium RM2_2_4]
MLIDDCIQLSRASQNASDLKKYAADLNKFRDRQGKIEPLVQELSPLVTALRTFRERGLANFDCGQKSDELLREVTTTLAEFQKNRGWLIEQFKSTKLKNKVSALKSELEGYLKQAWGNYKRQRIPNTNDELLGLLAKIETFKPTVQSIQRLLNQLKAVDFPKDAQQFEKIDQEIDDLSTAWKSLKSNEVPEAVLNFLRSAATHGATIDLLTPEVQNWLNEHGISRFLLYSTL